MGAVRKQATQAPIWAPSSMVRTLEPSRIVQCQMKTLSEIRTFSGLPWKTADVLMRVRRCPCRPHSIVGNRRTTFASLRFTTRLIIDHAHARSWPFGEQFSDAKASARQSIAAIVLLTERLLAVHPPLLALFNCVTSCQKDGRR